MDTYKITKIINVRPDAYNGATGIDFNTDKTGGQKISVLTKYPDTFTEGSEQFGDVIPKEKDGRTYYNFTFGKKTAQTGGMSDNDRAMIKRAGDESYAARVEIQKLYRALLENGVIKELTSAGTEVPFPDYDINPEDVPF